MQADTLTGGRSNVRNLSFFADATWNVPSGMLYAEACALGRDRGEELSRMMEGAHNPALFGGVTAAIVKAGDWGPVETGFFQYFAERAI